MKLPTNDHLTEQQQMEALAAYMAQVREHNIKECKAVDKAHDYSFAPKSGKQDKLTESARAKRDAKTLHDYLQENPGLCKLYKSGGFEALLGL